MGGIEKKRKQSMVLYYEGNFIDSKRGKIEDKICKK